MATQHPQLQACYETDLIHAKLKNLLGMAVEPAALESKPDLLWA